jgi:hypothetical protein
MFFRSFINWIVEGATTFETQATVKIKDPRLGLFNTLMTTLALLYIILFELMFRRGYMEIDPPEGGSVRVSFRLPHFERLEASKNLHYCTQEYYPGLGCRYVAEFSGATEHSILVPTRVNLTLFNDLKPGCTGSQHGLYSSDRNCVYNIYENRPDQQEKSISFYASYPEHYTVLVDHLISSPSKSQVYTSRSIRGWILDSDGNRMVTFPKNGSDKDYVFTVQQILDAGGVDLDEIVDGKDLPKRYDGLVLLAMINYENPWYRPWEITYGISVQEATGTEYKHVQAVFDNLLSTDPTPMNHFTVENTHGIRIMFIQTGSIGAFSIINLLLNIVAGMAMLDVAAWIVEFVMLNIVTEKDIYEGYKFTSTREWGETRKQAIDLSQVDEYSEYAKPNSELKTLEDFENAVDLEKAPSGKGNN